jgi:hypothetical protein
MADPGGAQLDQHFVSARLVQLHLGDLERRVGAAREGGLDLHCPVILAIHQTICKVSIFNVY